MQFQRALRQRIMLGEITCSVRIWQQPRVRAGGRYRLEDGHVLVDGIDEVDASAITPALAQQSGFASVADLLAVAQHGRGERVFVVHFHYVADGTDADRSG